MDKCSFLHTVPVLVQQKHLRTSYKLIRVKAGEIICNLNQVSQSGEPCTVVMLSRQTEEVVQGQFVARAGLCLLECLLTRAGLRASME